MCVDARPIFIRDGAIATSGGVTAALDLTLAFIEEDHGPELARWVALGMVTYLKRPGNQAQMSLFTATPRPEDGWCAGSSTMSWPTPTATSAPLSSRPTPASASATSPACSAEQLGEPPGQLVRRVRLEVAARMLTLDRPAAGQIARACGFSSTETLRQAFVASYGIPPSRFRAVHRSATGSGSSAPELREPPRT